MTTPGQATSSLAQARALVQVRRFSEAAALLSAVIAAEPASVQPWCLLAQCRLGLNDPGGALDAASHAVAAGPEEEWAHRLRSRALLQLKRKKDALTAAREAARLAPNLQAVYLTLTDAELANRHLKEAGVAAERARSINPDGLDGHNAMGLVALRKHKFGDAEAHFRKALQCNPQSAQALNNLGVALQGQGRRPQAIHYFAEASRLDPRMTAPRRNAVQAAKAGPAMVALVVLFTLTRSADAGLTTPLTIGAIMGVTLLAVRWLRGRRNSGPVSDDPKASKQLLRELRREPGAGTIHMGTGVRIGWLARSVGIFTLGMPAVVLTVGGAVGIVQRDFVNAAIGLGMGLPLGAGAGFLIYQMRRAG